MTRKYPDGAKYIRQFKDDNRHGKGTLTFADGRKLIGEWKEGKFVK